MQESINRLLLSQSIVLKTTFAQLYQAKGFETDLIYKEVLLYLILSLKTEVFYGKSSRIEYQKKVDL
jgi:hypothetical protein